MSFAGVLLAAGAGRRFGRPKALVALDGDLLVERGARLLADGGCAPVLVVLGAGADEVRARASLLGATVVVNEDWETGIGSSLRVGLVAAAASVAYLVDAAVVVLVDQPRVTAQAVCRLITAHTCGATVASYHGEPCHPVVLDRSTWPAVVAAAIGNVGARGFLRAHPELVQIVPCDDVSNPFDLDTPGDLQRMEQRACR